MQDFKLGHQGGLGTVTRYCALKKHGSPGESGDSDPVLCFEEAWVTRGVWGQ